jgi:hypothetical protein
MNLNRLRVRALRPSLRIALPVLLPFLLALGCVPRAFHNGRANAKQASPSIPERPAWLEGEFCERSEAEAKETADTALFALRRDTPGHVWTAAEVQHHINDLIDGHRATDEFVGSPASAYVWAYRSMTAGRDQKRCHDSAGNAMRASEPLDRRINDHLADVMTRSLVNVTRHCYEKTRDGQDASRAQGASSADFQVDIGGLWCELFAYARNKDVDAVSFAMMSTALYLTINLGYGLSALPHVDTMWEGTEFALPPDATTDQRKGLLARRVQRLKKYQPTYNAFNDFLADNAITVAKALSESGLVKCSKRFELAAKVADEMPGMGNFYELFRTLSFNHGIDIARHTPLGEHPLVQPFASEIEGKRTLHVIWTGSAAGFLPQAVVNDELASALNKMVELGRRARAVFERHTFKLFGGITFSEARLRFEKGIAPRGCFGLLDWGSTGGSGGTGTVPGAQPDASPDSAR